MSIYLQNMYNQFTIPWNGNNKIYKQLEEFAKSLGWYPSDIIEDKRENSIVTGHLFVEHGLENSAVITFLNDKYSFSGLNIREQIGLLKISYNNLVDIHISTDKSNVYGFHNRIENNNSLLYQGKIQNNFTNLSSDFYSEILSKRPLKTNLLSLDDALIDTISFWKRLIASEVNNNVSNEQLSNLFNTIIFCRAVEDHYKNNNLSLIDNSEEKTLLNILIRNDNINIEKVVELVLEKYSIKKWPENILSRELLKIFNYLDKKLLFDFFNDFYLNKFTPYEYDFSIISKHALSRIYERYVSILKVEHKSQTTLFAPLPFETTNKSTGSYYTPQFIARFFSRYLEQFIPEFKYKLLKIVEPSIGSGIFLRTLLERKFDLFDEKDIELIERNFEQILGVDTNLTACHAANLSLSLLYLVTTGSLPKKKIEIINEDSLDYFNNKNFKDTVDIVISNPPFVAYNSLNTAVRDKIKGFLNDLYFGRSDLYLSFVKIALDTLKVGGIGLFVLPNTFLISDSAKLIRKALAERTFIRCIVDFSDIQIFEDVGVYPILLIFEKIDKKISSQKAAYSTKPIATIAKIQDKIGEALSNILNNTLAQGSYYSIYNVNQSFFGSENWYLLPPTEYNLKNKLSSFKKLSDFMKVRTGFSSGAGDIFLVEKNDIPTTEQSIYIPYLSDREMEVYKTPIGVDKYLFYPFVGEDLISENELITNYPKTYKKLLAKKHVLAKRNEVIQNKILWWEPNRPRKPSFMLVPKVLTPHLIFTPKFNIDIEGKFAVSRTPFIVLKEDFHDAEMLYFFAAVLNSSVCFWYLLNHAPKYQNGYAMVERKYLDDLPIPDPYNSDRFKISQIIRLVKDKISNPSAIEVENKIDKLVTELYKLSADERTFLNI